MLRICYRLCVGIALLASAGAAEQRVSSEYRNYSIRLMSWRPVSTRPSGVLVGVRIDGGRMLRLIVDTGASGIVLTSRAARDLELHGPAALAGLGEKTSVTVQTAIAASVRIGELELSDCDVTIARDLSTHDADGVIGMNVFEDFRIHLNANARELKLEAFPEKPLREAHDHLLFVKARVNGKTEGLFLVDTGSATTSLASDLPWPAAISGEQTLLSGASGQVTARRLAPVSLEIAGQKVVEREPVSLDLNSVSRLNGVKVAGILGYSVLSRAPVTFNYRDGVVELGVR